MTQPLRVMRVLANLGRGGMEKAIVDEIEHHDGRRFSISVCCVGTKGEYGRELEGNGNTVHLCTKNNGNGNLPLPLKLAKLFKDERIDIVHSYSGVYRDATLGARLARIPVVIHTDQGKFYPDTGWARLWTRFNHQFFSNFRDRVIAVSNELRDFLIKDVGISEKKINVIYNAVDVKDHELKIDIDQKKKEFNILPDEKVIGIVARLVPIKDHKTLLAAFQKVVGSRPRIRLLVVGDGPLKDSLQLKAYSLKLKDKVIFTGKRTDVNELLHIMDIVCLSSLSEGLSLTLLEAMASSKPVIATNVGGNPELVVDGVTGLLVPPESPDKMAEVILQLLNNDAKRRSMGELGKKRVEEKFNIKNTVKQYEELYLNLAREKGVIS